MLANKPAVLSKSSNVVESEQTLVASPGASNRHPKVHYPKKRGKVVGLHVLAKPNLVDLNAKAGEIYLGRSATSRADKDARSSVFLQRYVSVRLLGEGGNGTVHLCRDTTVGTLVAVKTIHHNEPMSPPNEVHILHLLGYHQNIVRYHTMLEHPTLEFHVQLIFEYCPIGDLVDYINAAEGNITELFSWHVFKHVAAGLQYMHQNNIVHGDIKSCNILLTAPRDADIYPLPKIADFGTAQVSPPRNVPYGHLCTVGYQPPEAEYRHGPAADVWALGCIVHELALSRLPLQEIEPPEIEPRRWFELSGKHVPTETQCHFRYKQFCFYMAFHPPAPVRIDCPSPRTSAVYSRLLNYLMMRALDMDPRNRISTHELRQMLPVLEPFVHNMLVLGQEPILNQFNDGRDSDWREIEPFTDSQVFRQIFCAAALQANREWSMEILSWCAQLLKLMDPDDQVAACDYVVGLELNPHLR